MDADHILRRWSAPISSLKGVGPKLGVQIEALVGGRRLADLVFHRPSRWMDRSLQSSIASCLNGETQTVKGEVQKFEAAGRGSKLQKVRLADDTGFLTIVFFNSNTEYLKRQFPIGQTVLVSGKIEDFHGQRQMTHPDYVVPDARASDIPLVEPVYPLTAGLTNRRLLGFIRQALTELPELPDWLSDDARKKSNWPEINLALQTLHKPDRLVPEDIEQARERLAHDEALSRALAFQEIRSQVKLTGAIPISASANAAEQFARTLTYPLTSAQERAMAEISHDLDKEEPMQRLLQGDVGAGKTTVAAYGVYLAAKSGGQAAVMAPTEVLARQLFEAINAMLEPLGMSCACLTGRDKGGKRRDILEEVANGQTQVLCGTHALFQNDVEFNDLRLVVVDEQHRFGVNDRARLQSKGKSPHLLIMSATPIPRSLSMTVYGDIDLSILDEKPAGRQPVDTRLIAASKIGDVLDGVVRAVSRKEQVFWVCPNVEDENDDSISAVARHAVLSELLEGGVGLVHSRLKADEKQAALERFRSGETRVLVATTVIEVGVDVPNATIMVIEGAERFGLAQLHQLRGRVGRGSKASFCILVYTPPLGETARTRLNTLRESEDGFYIAEVDFKLRGPGDVLGLAQSGLPDFRFIDLSKDQMLLASAARHAKYLSGRKEETSEETKLLRHLFGTGDGVQAKV